MPGLTKKEEQRLRMQEANERVWRVPCPRDYCRAGVGEACRSSGGNLTWPHIPRVDAAREAGAPSGDPEAELRSLWTESGVPEERQDELIEQIEEKARPGARVGPFRLPERQAELPLFDLPLLGGL